MTEESRILLQGERSAGGPTEATVFATGARLPIEAAARVNGYMGDVFELNDLIAGHATIGVGAAALAVAEATGASGAALLRALIAGIEVVCRVHSAYYPFIKPYTEAGLAPPGLPNTVGAAAAAALLWQLDEAHTQEALMVAGALAGWCPTQAIFGNGGTVKPMLHGAWPAGVGVQGARYARAGLRGTRQLLEGKVGYYGTVGTRFDAARILAPPAWQLANPRRKLHACCGYIHSALDMVRELRLRHGAAALRGADIVIAMPPYVLPAVSGKPAPNTPNEARFHTEYMVALIATGTDAIRPADSIALIERLRDPALREIMARVRIIAEPGYGHYEQCRVELRRADGDRLTIEDLAPRGAPANPLSEAQVKAKFRDLAAPRLHGTAAERFIERVLRLEHEPDLCFLASELG